MTTAYTSLLGLALPVTGELSGTWGSVVNDSITSLLDTSVAGTTNVSADSNVTLTTTTGASNQARQAILLFSGARTAIRTVTAPAQSKIYTVINATTGGFAVQLVGAGPTTGVTIANGARTVVAWNGSDFVEVSSPSSIILPGGTANGVLYLNGSKVVTSGSALTYNGSTFKVAGADASIIAGFSGTTKGIRIETTSTGSSIGGVDSALVNSFEPLDINGSYTTYSTSGTERMRLTSTGLGIGTTSNRDSNKLDVRGDVSFGSNVSYYGQLAYNAGVGSIDMTSSDGAFRFIRQSGSVTSATLDSSGNLGLGVTPSAWSGSWKAFQVGSRVNLTTNGTDAILTNNAYNSGSSWIYQNSSTSQLYLQGSGQHAWYNAPSGTAGNAITFTQAMTLSAAGNLGIGTTSPSDTSSYGRALDIQSSTGAAIYLRDSDNPTTDYGFVAYDSSIDSLTLGSITASTGIMRLLTAGSEAARITSGGIFAVGITNPTGSSADAVGIQLTNSNYIQINRSGGALIIANRKTNDGTLISLQQDETEEGTISVSGTTVSYNGGHLSRWAQMLTKPELFKGTVMSNLDEMNVYTKDGQPVDNEQLNKVKVSDVEGDANVAGVFVNWTHDDAHDVDEINMAMTGDMIIRIAQGTTVQRGDLLMSAGNGTAKPQGDDIVRSKTVAKVTSTHVTCTYADGSYCVPCVLMAC
jgi:hypothetical protein